MKRLRFKVGDKARIIDKRCKYYGQECTIVEILIVPKTKYIPLGYNNYNNYTVIYDYKVIADVADKPGWMPDESLEPIAKNKELSSWEEIEKLTNWNPTKTKATSNT